MTLELSEAAYIMHFGVKGMQWGVRKKDKTSGRNGAPTKVGMTPDEAVFATYVGMGLAFVTAMLTARGVQKVMEPGDAGDKNRQRMLDKGETFNKKPALAKKKMSEDEIMTNVVKHINPEYGAPGTKNNCMRCTYAYEMRRRGYDVRATKSRWATGQDESGAFNAQSPNSQMVKRGDRSIMNARRNNPEYKSFMQSHPGPSNSDIRINRKPGETYEESILKEIGKQPNGARGELVVRWAFGGGHSVAWEVVNGKPVVFDTQNGKKIKTGTEMFDAFQKLTIADSGITRLDNKQLNEDFLMRWMSNA